jgi:hypothetical protein
MTMAYWILLCRCLFSALAETGNAEAAAAATAPAPIFFITSLREIVDQDFVIIAPSLRKNMNV